MGIQSTCRHEFAATPIDKSRFARVCRCGVTEPCTQEELLRFLDHCLDVRREYLKERSKAKSKESAKAFDKGIDIKNSQILWLKSQVLRKGGK